eukprot:9245638-Ditylum_brightwellii.AAC.1
MRREVKKWWRWTSEKRQTFSAEDGRRWALLAAMARANRDNSKKFAAAAMARSKTAAMVMANQDGDAKPVKMGMGSRQEGACHT